MGPLFDGVLLPRGTKVRIRKQFLSPLFASGVRVEVDHVSANEHHAGQVRFVLMDGKLGESTRVAIRMIEPEARCSHGSWIPIIHHGSRKCFGSGRHPFRYSLSIGSGASLHITMLTRLL